MKTTIKILVALLALAAGTPSAVGQSITPIVISGSTIKQYPSLKGTKEIIRSSTDNNFIVSCGYTADRRSFFIVKNGNTVRSFYASPAIDPIIPHGSNNNGHEILDMVMDGATCWVCGRYWYETGELGYTIEGNAFWMTEEKGFIGKFDARYAAVGNCTFYTYPINGTNKVTSIAAGGGSVAFITGDGGYAVEAVPLNNDTLSLTKVTPPFNANEVFMDVAYAGGKHVFLSRFDIPNSMYHRYRIGLRYVSPGDIANMQTMHVYDTWQLFYSNGWFAGLEPVHICATNSGDGVAVSWVETDENNPDPSYIGHLFTLKIDSEGATTFYGFHTTDNAVYTRIKDVGFGNPSHNNPYMTVLLEDETGVSVFRYINTSCTTQNTCSCPMLKLATPKSESVAPIQMSSSNLAFRAAGYYENDDNKVAELFETNIISHSPLWEAANCMTYSTGYIYSARDNTPASHEVHTESENKTVTTGTSHAIKRSLTPSVVLPVNKCSK